LSFLKILSFTSTNKNTDINGLLAIGDNLNMVGFFVKNIIGILATEYTAHRGVVFLTSQKDYELDKSTFGKEEIYFGMQFGSPGFSIQSTSQPFARIAMSIKLNMQSSFLSPASIYPQETYAYFRSPLVSSK
jgi:hypothetical protein